VAPTSCSRRLAGLAPRAPGIILTGRNPNRLERAAAGLPEQIDHVMVTAAGPAFR
jgi:hypothetical protein